MFEKSLYDLIKGLRQHKGNEKDFIDHSLQECRKEIRGADMDVKATALLKLVYLEMFGYDMSWASFNILEVMSSPRQQQKRIGYLGAMQSFGPSTDVLMLAINLLKKDVTSPSIPTISLPLVTVPHIATPGLASTIVPDLLARVGHSSPNIRKKSIVTLYRLALVWPEALRPAWPKMKDILENDDEDPSVTSTVVNVVCELVWRRPQDFLPLAPRFFELLISGGNNWMAIKLIKLFAILTPLEPRLVRKLAPALANLINTTTAMSVLYECINGVIQGGILDDVHYTREGDEIAELCVEKLCGMIDVDGDPNLKYVSLLAFNRIVLSHPQLVSTHLNVIAMCLDDNDISIRLQALSLVAEMVDQDTIAPIVGKLLQQLEQRRSQRIANDRNLENADGTVSPSYQVDVREYDTKMVRAVLEMCSRNLYGNITDFDWYIDVLIRLVRLTPQMKSCDGESDDGSVVSFNAIGLELLNVAVRVKSARAHATEAANTLLSAMPLSEPTENSCSGANIVLKYAAFIVGEYPGLLHDVTETLNVVLLRAQQDTSPQIMVSLLQAVPKLLGFVFSSELQKWDGRKHAQIELLLARVTSTVEPYVSHAGIETQENAVTLLELSKIAEASLSKHSRNELMAPALIRDIFPSIFVGQELNPVAASAQLKIPSPASLDLERPINASLSQVLEETAKQQKAWIRPDSNRFYHDRETWSVRPQIALETDDTNVGIAPSRKQPIQTETNNHNFIPVKDLIRAQESFNPFNISEATQSPQHTNSAVHDIIQDSNGQSIDIDSIPIMELKIGIDDVNDTFNGSIRKKQKPNDTACAKQAEIAMDETFLGEDSSEFNKARLATMRTSRRQKPAVRGLLQVDSSTIGSFKSSTNDGEPKPELKYYSSDQTASFTQDSDAEMRKALAEVERLRLEMQRAQDRVVIADDIPQEGTLVAKKAKKKQRRSEPSKPLKKTRKKPSSRSEEQEAVP